MSDTVYEAYVDAFFNEDDTLKCDSEWRSYPLRTDFTDDICLPRSKKELKLVEKWLSSLKTSDRFKNYSNFVVECRKHLANLSLQENTCTHCGKVSRQTLKRCDYFDNLTSRLAKCDDRVCDECSINYVLYSRVMCKNHYHTHKDSKFVDWFGSQYIDSMSYKYREHSKPKDIPLESRRMCDRK